MSSDEDSETAEWEREQMLRGTQSRGQKYHQTNTTTSPIDVSVAKTHIYQDIERSETAIESARRSIGQTIVSIAESGKRIEAIKKQIEELEADNLDKQAYIEKLQEEQDKQNT